MNILLILTDQHHADYLGCLGHPCLPTPNLDALAGQARVFHAAYTPAPICGPARASLFTGQSPLRHGVCKNWVSPADESRLLTHRLRDAGWFTALVGKLHISPVGDAHGFAWRRLCDSPHDVYDPEEIVHNDYLPWAAAQLGLDPKQLAARAGDSERCRADDGRFWQGWPWTDDARQITTWTGNEAVAFLESPAAARPFFLNVSFFGPHHPYATCEPWDSLIDPAAVPLPATLEDAPPAGQQGRRFAWPERRWRELIARYCGNIAAIDAQIGRLLAALRERGLWDDTLIIFSADHGDHMGEFAMLGKGTMLESSVRIPLLIKPPGPPQSRRDHHEVVSLMDLYPTLLDYAGYGPQTRSLRPLLTVAAPPAWENETFSYIGSADGRAGRAMIIREHRKLVATLADGELSATLLDRTARPADTRILDEPATQAALEARLREWLETEKPDPGNRS